MAKLRQTKIQEAGTQDIDYKLKEQNTKHKGKFSARKYKTKLKA